MNALDDFCLGYVLGLLIGEGHFGGGVPRSSAVVVVRMHENDPQPIFALHRLLGGRINGPYHPKDGRHVLGWKASGPDAFRIAALLIPCFPPSRKREQFRAWGERYGLDMSGLSTALIPTPGWTTPRPRAPKTG